MKMGKKEWALILGFVLAALVMNLPVVFTCFYHELTGAPRASRGVIDLSATGLSNDRILLDGEWEFYWNRLIESEPQPSALPDLFVRVPDAWSAYSVRGERLPAWGYGSYRLILTGLSYDKPVALYLPDFGGACRVFIDGRLAAESGVVSKDLGEVFTVPKSAIYPVTLSAGSAHEAVVEVATTRFSGLYMTPVLSDYHGAVSRNDSHTAARFILFGITLFSLIGLLTMYALTVRRKLFSFWLPAMSFLIMLRIMLTSEFYSVCQGVLFFNLSYESTNEAMFLATFALKYLLIFLVQEQCGIRFSKREKTGFLMYYLLLYLIYLLTPQSFYNQHLSVLLPMLTYALDIHLFFKVYRGRRSMKRYGMAVFWGAILFMAGLSVDSYYLNGRIGADMSLTLPLFFTGFALIMCFVYVKRSVDLYDNFTQSASRLELATSQLAMQKEYYEALSGQMNEIRKIKHDIRHFIRVMSRLAEEERYDELKAFLREYGERTEMERLPVFCENVVANSIIGYYCLQAREDGIAFDSRVSIGNQAVISDSDICIILGNALENALEACRQLENRDRAFVSIEAEGMQKQLLIRIRNSLNGRLETREGRYVSSKRENSHGMGLQNIERVVASCGGFVKTEQRDKEFLLMASIPEK